MFLVFIFGIVLGIACGFAITAFLADKSNNKGDSKASFRDWSNEPLKIIEKKDNIKYGR